MNETFSIKRFGALGKKTLMERPVQLFGFTVMTLVLTALIYIISKPVIGFEEAQNLAFVLGFIGGGGLLSSFAFNYFSSHAYGSSYLTLPASTLEKWLVGILIVIGFAIVFLVFFKALDYTLVEIYRNTLDIADPYYKERYDAVQLLPLNGFVASKLYIMYVNVAGLMLLGSLYFNKSGFIKCALIACGLFIVVHLLNQFISTLFIESTSRALPYYGVFVAVGKEEGKVLLPDYASLGVDILLYLIPLILWFTAWIRLREKEF
jgi:hypothetical protein